MKKKNLTPILRIVLFSFALYSFVSTAYAQKGGGTPPPTPPAFNVSTNVCGTKTLTKVGSPPTGVLWYWGNQSNPAIASLVDASNPYTVTTSGTYYLFPQFIATHVFGTPTSASVTVNLNPAAAPTPSISQQCGVSVLTESTAPSGVTYYWQDTNSAGQSTANSSATYNAQSSGTYYIKARSSAGCWGPTTSIPVTVNLIPPTPPIPIVSTNNCGPKSLSFNGTPPGNVNWWWLLTPNGTSSSNMSSSFSATSTGSYYLRALDSNNGCWSNSSQVSVTVYPIPYPPVAVPSSGGEGTAIPLSATPGQFGGDNINWYASSTGGTPLTTSTTYNPVLASTTTFYITTLNSVTACESGSRMPVTASVNPSPVIIASAPAIIQGQGIALSVASSYDTYSWQRNNVEFSTAPTTFITNPGTYTVTVTKSGLTGSGTSPAFNAAIQYQRTYVMESQLQKPGINSVAAADMLAIGDCQRSVTYVGGFGNVLQKALPQYSPLKKDVIQPVEYTPNGMQVKKYLPYVNGDNGGSYRVNSINNAGYTNSDQYQFYQQTATKIPIDTKPYAATAIEPSPVHRVTSQTGPGAAWHDNQKSNKIFYLLSRASDNITLWSIDVTGSPISAGIYPDYQLSKTITYDENNNSVITYADREGHVIQKSQQASPTDWLQTIYIYNDLNQLLYILQPEGFRNLSGNPSQSFLDAWAFQFHYDALGRKIESKAPGAGWEYLVYDALDRPLLSQNGNQRVNNQWSFVKYDIFGRPVMMGVKSLPGSTRTSLQLQADAQTSQYEVVQNTSTGYTLNATIPAAAETDLISVTYYDSYDFMSYAGWDAENHSFVFVPELGISAWSGFTSGLPTGSKKRIITSNGVTGAWLNGVQYYDDHNRLIQTVTENHKNGLDRNTILLNSFTGRMEQSLTTEGTGSVTVLKKYEYDHVNRLQKIWQNINNAPSDQLVVKYEYNELGQLVDKKLHGNGTSFLQSIDYRYSIRGWLRSVNGAQLIAGNDNEDGDSSPDYFGMDLMYEAADVSIGNTALFNGNVSAIKFKGPGSASGMPDQKGNIFTYDQADRLSSTSTKKYGTTSWNKDVNINNETFNYDYNGNIKSMSRSHSLRGMSGGAVTNTPELMDNLTYTYSSGNQLSKVDDSVPLSIGIGDFKDGVNLSTEYAYDGAGNLSSDANKGISSITYNILNLPKQIAFSDGRHLEYTYDATGVKLTMQTFATGNVLQTTTDYVNGFVFANNTLNFFGSPEGRVVKNGAAFDYQYSIADNQGNTRVVFSATTPVAQAATASFEAGAEASAFDDYPSISGISSLYNHTTGGTESQRLTGSYSSMIGVAKSYKVCAGDQLKIEAYARYDAPTTSNSSGLTGFATALLSAFNLAAPLTGETGTASAALNTIGNLTAGGWGDGSPDITDPKAFVNILLFDKNYNFLDVSYAQVTSAGAFTYLSASYLVKEAGYAYVYISNEQTVQTDVYFDDITMTYTPTNILQYNEYYAHGLQNSNSWTRDNTANNFLYNGASELNNLSALYDLAYRNYDATLGRFHQVDPLAVSTQSTYQYCNNNPILFNDPMGLDKKPVNRHNDNRGKRIIDFDYWSWYANSADSHVAPAMYLDGFMPEYFEGSLNNQNQGRTGSRSDGDWEFTPYGTYAIDPVTGEEIEGTRTIDGYTATPTRPDFATMFANYPGSNVSKNDLLNDIGGKVKQNFTNNAASYSNTCAIRFSRALNLSGYPIPYIAGQTGSGSNGDWYFYRVNDLISYLTDTFGAPDITNGDETNLANQQGIIFFQVDGWGDARGHVDMWNGTNCGKQCYWPASLLTGTTLVDVKLWTLP